MADTKRCVALTTVDNPWSPFDNFENWYKWDIQHGYYSCAYLDRVANTNDQMHEDEIQAETERAIDEIVALNPLNKYIKVVKDSGIQDESNIEERDLNKEDNAKPKQNRKRFTIEKPNESNILFSKENLLKNGTRRGR